MNTPHLSGHTWHPRPGISPCLATSYRYVRTVVGLSREIMNANWVLDYTLTGNSRYRAGAAAAPWFDRPADTAHLYAPGTPYWEDLRHAEIPAVSFWITFTGGSVAGLEQLTKTAGYARISDYDGLIRTPLERLNAIAREQGDTGFWECQAAYMEIINILLQCGGSGPEYDTRHAGSPERTGLAAMVRHYIEENLAGSITLEHIARHCSVSVSTLTHKYRIQAGETPWQTVLRLRMDRARSLLLHGERLKEIADRTGFSDEYHLSRAFKQHTGKSPRAFLQKQRS